MGFFISAMLSARGRAYLCKCALSRADNSADMEKTHVIIFISLV